LSLEYDCTKSGRTRGIFEVIFDFSEGVAPRQADSISLRLNLQADRAVSGPQDRIAVCRAGRNALCSSGREAALGLLELRSARLR